ncbi:MAG: NUDIX domain-containing protein, partial [Streptosporangiaceae bacterium]
MAAQRSVHRVRLPRTARSARRPRVGEDGGAAAQGRVAVVTSTRGGMVPQRRVAVVASTDGGAGEAPGADGGAGRARGADGGASETPAAAAWHMPPAIPASAGAMIFDRRSRLLILKPTYKSGWTIPGGEMEADGETPWQACRREVREECGLDVQSGALACVDFRPPKPGRPGGLRFLFDCGVLPDDVLAGVTLQAEEIAEYRLAPLPEALKLLSGPVRRRVRRAAGG